MVWEYIPLIRKCSVTHMHGLLVYVKEGRPLACYLFLYSEDSYLRFWQVFLFLYVTSFIPVNHYLVLFAQFLMLSHLTVM